MISTETAFNDLGVDAVTGTELMEWLGISPADFVEPLRFSRFHEVIDYFKDMSPDTRRYMIRRATHNKNVDKLQYVWEYTQLLKQKRSMEESMEKLKNEGSALGPDSDPVLRMDHAQKEISARDELNRLTQEVEIYER